MRTRILIRTRTYMRLVDAYTYTHVYDPLDTYKFEGYIHAEQRANKTIPRAKGPRPNKTIQTNKTQGPFETRKKKEPKLL